MRVVDIIGERGEQWAQLTHPCERFCHEVIAQGFAVYNSSLTARRDDNHNSSPYCYCILFAAGSYAQRTCGCILLFSNQIAPVPLACWREKQREIIEQNSKQKNNRVLMRTIIQLKVNRDFGSRHYSHYRGTNNQYSPSVEWCGVRNATRAFIIGTHLRVNHVLHPPEPIAERGVH